MARKTVEELQLALEKAQEAEALATDGLDHASDRFNAAYDGIIDGTPEQLAELKLAFGDLVAAVKANWRYRGRPVMTEEARTKAVAATKKSQAKRKAKEAVPA